MIKPYSIAACQTNIYPYFPDEAMTPHPENLEKNLARACELVSYHARSGVAKLYVFSEFFLTGSPAGSPAEFYLKVAIKIPGPEIEELAATAWKRGVFIAGQAYEIDDLWPDRFFNTAFIIDPGGKVILKYRKHYDQTCKTKPGDVWDEYVEKVGTEALFPVVDTEIGRLGALVCYDVNFLEVARTLALKGAEVLIHPTSETRSPYHIHGVGGWEIARRTRAWENVAYWVSADQANFLDSVRPTDMMHGWSQILGPDGRVINIAETSNETIIMGEVDIEALRRRRNQVGMNFLAQAQPHLYAHVLREKQLWPKNLWAGEPVQTARQNNEATLGLVEELQESGVFAKPAEPVQVQSLERPG